MVGNRTIGWRIRTVVARSTLVNNGSLGMIPLAGCPARHVVTGATSRQGGWDMGARLAGGRNTMATRTVGCSGKQAVVNLGPRPCAGGLVATFTISRHRGVRRRRRLASQTIVRGQATNPGSNICGGSEFSGL